MKEPDKSTLTSIFHISYHRNPFLLSIRFRSLLNRGLMIYLLTDLRYDGALQQRVQRPSRVLLGWPTWGLARCSDVPLQHQTPLAASNSIFSQSTPPFPFLERGLSSLPIPFARSDRVHRSRVRKRKGRKEKKRKYDRNQHYRFRSPFRFQLVREGDQHLIDRLPS